MNPNDYKKGDYVSIYAPDGEHRGYGTVVQGTYSGYWVTEENGDTVLFPRELLRPTVRVTQDPKDVVSVPHPDPVVRAQAEYDRLKQAQVDIDERNAERLAKRIHLRRELEQVDRHLRATAEQRRVNSQRMTELKTFLKLAETI